MLVLLWSIVLYLKCSPSFNVAREQAGFRSGFSTIDHIHVISQLHDNTDEYRIPPCFAFVDYEKTCDSIQLNPIFEALEIVENQGVEAAYITIYEILITALHLHWSSTGTISREE